MKVYHGSYTAVEVIDLTKCEPRKDFGQLSDEATKLYQKPWQEIRWK